MADDFPTDDELDEIERYMQEEKLPTPVTTSEATSLLAAARDRNRIAGEVELNIHNAKVEYRRAEDYWAELVSLRAKVERLTKERDAVQATLTRLTTCWHCHCELLLDLSPAHCLDCPSECEGCEVCK